jgi:hypothetical protein
VPTRVKSDSAVNFTLSSEKAAVNIRSYNTTGNLENGCTTGTKEKWGRKVRFSSAVRVILIATKEDFERAGLLRDLWYTEDDFNSFKATALQEFNNLVARGYGHLTRQEIKHVLYQQSPQFPLGEIPAPAVQSPTSFNSLDLNGFSAQESPTTPEKTDNSLAIAFPPTEGGESLEALPVFCITADSAQKFKVANSKKTGDNKHPPSPRSRPIPVLPAVISPVALMCDI